MVPRGKVLSLISVQLVHHNSHSPPRLSSLQHLQLVTPFRSIWHHLLIVLPQIVTQAESLVVRLLTRVIPQILPQALRNCNKSESLFALCKLHSSQSFLPPSATGHSS